MMVSGIVLTGLGGANLVIGAVFTAAARPLAEDSSTCHYYGISYSGTQSYSDSCVDDLEKDYRIAGIITLVSGGVLAGVGIPLLIVGAEKIPNDQAPGTEGAPPAQPSPVEALIPRLEVGVNDLRLRWDL